MTKVIIQKEFNTQSGLIIIVKSDEKYSVGDVITDGKISYRVKDFIMLSGVPTQSDVCSVFADRLN
jgi:hypothetical protein